MTKVVPNETLGYGVSKNAPGLIHNGRKATVQAFLSQPLVIDMASQILGIFETTVFCVLLNERKLVRPSLGRLGVIFDGGQASKANQSRE